MEIALQGRDHRWSSELRGRVRGNERERERETSRRSSHLPVTGFATTSHSGTNRITATGARAAYKRLTQSRCAAMERALTAVPLSLSLSKADTVFLLKPRDPAAAAVRAEPTLRCDSRDTGAGTREEQAAARMENDVFVEKGSEREVRKAPCSFLGSGRSGTAR